MNLLTYYFNSVLLMTLLFSLQCLSVKVLLFCFYQAVCANIKGDMGNITVNAAKRYRNYKIWL